MHYSQIRPNFGLKCNLLKSVARSPDPQTPQTFHSFQGIAYPLTVQSVFSRSGSATMCRDLVHRQLFIRYRRIRSMYLHLLSLEILLATLAKKRAASTVQCFNVVCHKRKCSRISLNCFFQCALNRSGFVPLSACR